MFVLKILLKAALLVFIILSIYFIVNPAACTNLMLGRVTNSVDTEPIVEQPADDHGELFTPAGDKPLRVDPDAASAQTETVSETPAPVQTSTGTVEGVIDTNTLKEAEIPTYSQEDIDYAVASRYVELENEYAKDKKIGKDTAKEISYKVMDDFEMSAEEWEAFLQRATETNLFNKIRTEAANAK